MLPNDSNDKLIAHDRAESKGDAMTRPSDRQNPRSWVVAVQHGGKPALVPSPWQPGYTNAHKATELEAVTYAWDKARAELEKHQELLHHLSNMIDEEQQADEAMDASLERPDFDGDMDAELLWSRGDI